MQKLHFPFINLPQEFLSLLKSNVSVTSKSSTFFEVLGQNRALIMVLEKSFSEFDDGRGLEKVFTALGWSSFRDRMASIYLYKAIHGDFPAKTNMDLVEDIKALESQYQEHGVHTFSRIFLLGFYLKIANLEFQKKQSSTLTILNIPTDLKEILDLSEARSEKIDWLLLIVWHLSAALGQKMVTEALFKGKTFDDLYQMMAPEERQRMNHNLLAYGASIKEEENFLYEKI